MHLLLHGQCMCAGYFVVVGRWVYRESVVASVACAPIQHFQQFPTISWRTKSESWTLMRWKWWQRLTAGGQLKVGHWIADCIAVDSWNLVDSWKAGHWFAANADAMKWKAGEKLKAVYWIADYAVVLAAVCVKDMLAPLMLCNAFINSIFLC